MGSGSIVGATVDAIVGDSSVSSEHDHRARATTIPSGKVRCTARSDIGSLHDLGSLHDYPRVDGERAVRVRDPIVSMVPDDAPAYPLALPVRRGCFDAPGAAPARRAARARAARHGAAPYRVPGRPHRPARTVDYDPIEDATVLVAGRGRAYPALTVAIGERMGLIGALSIETARSYLGARDLDGVVIGDGFNRSVVEDFVDELGADPRWRDLPVIVPPTRAQSDAERMPNADAVGGDARSRSRRTFSRSPACTPSRRG